MRRSLWLIGLLALLPSVAYAQEAVPPVKVNYVVDAMDARNGNAWIDMTIQNLPVEEVTVAIPAWRPGSYRILNFHTRIKDVTASAGGAKLDVEPVDKQTWKVKGIGKREATVRYRVTPDRDAIGADHYFMDGPGTFFYIPEHKSAACTVRYKLPEGWKAASGLSDLGDGIFGARDYDTFADCPTELGPFEMLTFKQDGVTYEVAVHAAGKYDSAGLIASIKKIVKSQCAMFGGAPFDRYVFLYHFRASAPGGGGLEHLNSTHISLPLFFVRDTGVNAASITSHEFFHLWNVKRIRPKELGPFDYTQPVRSNALWLCEGVTSYYGDLTLARCGIWNEASYFQHLSAEVETLQNNPARLQMSVEEAGRTVWDRGQGQRSLDYYNKGEILGWLIDLRIRALTNNKKSFDDVMRHLYEKHVTGPAKDGKGPIGVGFPEDGILKAINDVSGHDFTEFYGKYVSGKDELPYAEVGKAAGLKIDVTVERSAEFASSLRGLRVENVPVGSDDEKAGLRPGDRILEVAGVQVTTGATLRAELAKLEAGRPAAVKVMRDKEVELKLTPVGRERTRAAVARPAGAADKQKRLIDSWLGKDLY